jgi:hypothetical protein
MNWGKGRDDDFPRHPDKLIWALVLLVFAPIGDWLCRSYRLAHWPEPKQALALELVSAGATPTSLLNSITWGKLKAWS